MNVFSKIQIGIALLTALWLLANYLRPKVAALRASLAARAAQATKRVSDASLSVAPPVTHWSSVKAE